MVKELRTTSRLFLIILTAITVYSCKPRDYSKLPSFSKENLLQAVIEIPAGSNLVTYYCRVSLRFKTEMAGGKEKKIHYLPAPVNIGFIPSTRLGDSDNEGKLIQTMVIGERVGIGEVIDVIPLGMLVIKDEFQTDYIVIAIPARRDYQVVYAESFLSLVEGYPGIKEIIEDWNVNSGKYTNPVVLGWENEYIAQSFISKWLVKKRP